MSKETSESVASLAGRVLNISREEIGETGITVDQLLQYAHSLAGSALTQREEDPNTFQGGADATDIMMGLAENAYRAGHRDGVAGVGESDGWDQWEPDESDKDDIAKLDERLAQKPESDGLGIQVDLISVFDAWGAREAKDTAMLIDLCLGAAIEQLVPFTVESALWPAQVHIQAKRLEELAQQNRIVRLEAEAGGWSVRLLPPEGYVVLNDEWSKLGWVRRHIKAFRDYHATHDSVGVPFHRERRNIGDALLAVLDADPNSLVKNPPENEIADMPLQRFDSQGIEISGTPEVTALVPDPARADAVNKTGEDGAY